MEENIKDYFKEAFQISQVDPKGYSPLALAYIGDGVYELMIRTILVSKKDMQVQKYHKKASDLVKAQTQANMIHAIAEELTEEEMAVYKRGRNAKSYTMAKNATVSDYRAATGFEALIGYLYLKEDLIRAIELVKIALERKDV
ncbi:MAG: ribonuclease III [Lachnospiraceae bacterium]|nr:ribonuclease III [Lachnospiraceae bacterium]